MHTSAINDVPSRTINETHLLGHVWGDRELFAHLDLKFSAGVSLVRGEEQAGKSTLLRILSGELAPTSGWIQTNGIRAHQEPLMYAHSVFRTDTIHASLDQISPAQWFANLPERYPLFKSSVLAELVKAFGLSPHIGKPMYMLSAGSRRKVGISAAMASGAALTLIDQPFAALDGPSGRILREVLQDFTQQSERVCVIADYEAPETVPLTSTIAL